MSLMQAALAGALGSLGLVLLYHALATGSMSIAAPVSALTAAILPVVVGSFAEGLPGGLTLIGFAFALMAVWFVSQNQDGPRNLLTHIADLRLPLARWRGIRMLLCGYAFCRSGKHAVADGGIQGRRPGHNWPCDAHPSRTIARGACSLAGDCIERSAGCRRQYLLHPSGTNWSHGCLPPCLSSLYPGVTVILAGIGAEGTTLAHAMGRNRHGAHLNRALHSLVRRAAAP